MFDLKSLVSDQTLKTMKRCFILILCLTLTGLAIGCREQDGDQDTTPADQIQDDDEKEFDPTQDWCPTNSFVADIEGMPGWAQLSYEVGLTVIYVGGEITSETTYYSFTGCELYRDASTGEVTNDLCWVDVVDHNFSERFRAELQFYDLDSEQGFVLTANAYEGVYSTSYDFVCQ